MDVRLLLLVGCCAGWCLCSTDIGQLSHTIRDLKRKVLDLQIAKDADRETIKYLQMELKNRHTVLDGLQKGRDDLNKLDDQLRELKNELQRLVGVKEREVQVTGEVSTLWLQTDALRIELGDLKRDLQSVRAKREEDAAYLSQARTNQVSSKWVQRSLDEFRNQISDLSRAVNLSAAITQKQNLDSNLKLVRADFFTFQKEIEEMKAVQKRTVATQGLTQQDLMELRGRMQKLLVTQVHLGQQVDYLKEEILQPMSEDIILLPKDNTKDQTGTGANRHRARHHWKAEIGSLKSKLGSMARFQAQLQKELKESKEAYGSLNSSVYRADHVTRQLSNHTAALQSDHDAMLKEVYETKGRLEFVEEETTKHGMKLHNITHSVASIDKLHDSTMQLFRTMGSMEDKYDKNLSDLQKEMSKLEYIATQVQSSYDTLRENQADLTGTVTNLKKSVTVLQYRSEEDHLQLVGFKTRLANSSLNSCWGRSELSRMELKIDGLEKHVNNVAEKLGYAEEPEIDSASPKSYRGVKEDVRYPAGCSEVADSGLYVVRLVPDAHLKEVLCHRDSEDNVWTVVQRRTEGNSDFSRSWSEYSKGFGDATTDYWAGNQFLHNLTASAKCKLRIDMWDRENVHTYAIYDDFRVSSEKDNYSMHVGEYRGTSGDGLKFHDGLEFSTKDRDNDNSAANCALAHSGGWWYNHCQHVNLNGGYRKGIVWYNPERNKRIHLSRVEMKVMM